jgi:NAD(P)-dependent dehydrogenase (short-subunit alcohol dehydrogenase family)
VTGAARRIGRAIALALARDGWDVAVHFSASESDAFATARAIEALGRRAAAIRADLTDAGVAARLLDECAEALGPVGCVVNNASLFEYDEAQSFTPALFERLMRVNAAAPIELARQLHVRLRDGERGVAINLLDQKLWNPNPDFFSYTLSKSALREATRLLARALAPKLRVVAVAPGITLPSARQTAEEFAAAHARTPLGRSSTPEDVAGAVVYAARAGALTGATLLIDGGQHMMPSPRDVMFLTESR